VEEVIRIDSLSYRYPDGQKAINGLDLVVQKGESVALIGPNGAGKSTIILHLNGILHSNGAVKIMGQPVTDRNMRWIRSKVGLVFQNPEDQLFSPTVFDDVSFGPVNMGLSEIEVRRLVKKALEEVGMSGYEGRSPHHLSWGEKKRIAFATVLAMSPEIMVADEPTSNLDPRAKWSLIALLNSLQMTKIIASHDLDLVASVCSRAVIIDEGRVAADGTIRDILTNNDLLRAHGLSQ